MDTDEQIVSTLRVRIGQEEAHYGGNLVEGARVLKLFGDIVTEVAVVTDGDEGLFVGYRDVEFLAPVYAGDFLEITGRVVRVGNTSRTVELEARKVIASRYDRSPSAADLLQEPVTVVRAVGTTVIPAAHSGGRAAPATPGTPGAPGTPGDDRTPAHPYEDEEHHEQHPRPAQRRTPQRRHPGHRDHPDR